MYYFFFDNMQLPIPPKDLTIKPKNANKTAHTIGLGEINILKPTGLVDISFEVLLPNSNYPFNQSIFKSIRHAKYYLGKFDRLKREKKPFQFIVVRMKPNGEMLFNTNIRVVLEEYRLKESQDNGFDSLVQITLKQYKEAKTRRVRVEKNEQGELVGTIDASDRATKDAEKSFISNGGSILTQGKMATGKSVDVFSIARVNKLAVPFAVKVGEVVRLGK